MPQGDSAFNSAFALQGKSRIGSFKPPKHDCNASIKSWSPNCSCCVCISFIMHGGTWKTKQPKQQKGLFLNAFCPDSKLSWCNMLKLLRVAIFFPDRKRRSLDNPSDIPCNCPQLAIIFLGVCGTLPSTTWLFWVPPTGSSECHPNQLLVRSK